MNVARLTIEQVPSLPFISADLPGIGGEIKAEPAHFVVEEIPLYKPVEEGEHDGGVDPHAPEHDGQGAELRDAFGDHTRRGPAHHGDARGEHASWICGASLGRGRRHR